MLDNRVTKMMIHAVVLVTFVGLVAAAFDPELHAKYLTMPKSSFIEYFNAQNYSWKMAEYDNIEEKFTACKHFDMESLDKLPLLTHDIEPIDLPDNFDAREQWPECESIKEIYDQGDCGSCWAFGAVTSASDRTCIRKGVHVRLSEQDLECFKKNVCGGGYSSDAFRFWQDNGLVTIDCKPYDIHKLDEDNCVTECVKTDLNYKEDKHFAEKVYALSSDSEQIKTELVKNGPIQAGFEVYADFVNYKSGIYVHTHGRWQARHSVRVIGYGIEDGIEYWLVANSMGSSWGDHGWVKIKSYQEALDFEKVMHTGLAKN